MRDAKPVGPKYLLDTNICIYVIKRRPPIVLAKLKAIGLAKVAVSAVTISEMEFGLHKSKTPVTSRECMIEFLVGPEIIDFDVNDAIEFGRIRAYLEAKGTPIGPYDMQLAAQAVARNLIFVTNNEREFARVPGLKIQNWAK